MELTKEQMQAAKACGCTFIPVTEMQVARLSMQRRVFTFNGSPFVATRDDGGFHETHATLTLLIGSPDRAVAAGSRETVQQAAAADAVSEQEMLGERRAGGAQEVGRRQTAAGPRSPSRGTKRSG